MRRALLVCGCALIWSVALAIDTEQSFDDPALNARYRALIHEVRCMTCLNQSIADSNAFLAADLRREIHRMMGEGATDEQIVGFLVDRYGDSILYRPPVKPSTWALWGGPFALLLIGGVVFYTIVRARAKQPLGDDDDLGDDKEGLV